jgi:hypothetical protein
MLLCAANLSYVISLTYLFMLYATQYLTPECRTATVSVFTCILEKYWLLVYILQLDLPCAVQEGNFGLWWGDWWLAPVH